MNWRRRGTVEAYHAACSTQLAMRVMALAQDQQLHPCGISGVVLDKPSGRAIGGTSTAAFMCQRIRNAGILRSAVAGLVLGGFVLALFMSVSPELHKSLHHNAEDVRHECLVTVLHAGGCDSAVPAPVLSAVHEVVLFTASPILHAQWVEPLFLSQCVLEHAPPVMG